MEVSEGQMTFIISMVSFFSGTQQDKKGSEPLLRVITEEHMV